MTKQVKPANAAAIRAQIKELEAQLEAVEKEQTEQKLKEATAKIATLVALAEKSLQEATEIADEFNIEFSWSGPGYGMGGWYNSGEWQASSQSC